MLKAFRNPSTYIEHRKVDSLAMNHPVALNLLSRLHTRRTIQVLALSLLFGSSAARLLVLSTPSGCPLRDIFMRSCETSRTSIRGGLPYFDLGWGGSPSPLLHFISPSHELLAMAAASLDLPLTTRILSFPLPGRDPIRSLCQLRHHINMPHNPSLSSPRPHCARLVLIWPGMSSGKK